MSEMEIVELTYRKPKRENRCVTCGCKLPTRCLQCYSCYCDGGSVKKKTGSSLEDRIMRVVEDRVISSVKQIEHVLDDPDFDTFDVQRAVRSLVENKRLALTEKLYITLPEKKIPAEMPRDTPAGIHPLFKDYERRTQHNHS